MFCSLKASALTWLYVIQRVGFSELILHKNVNKFSRNVHSAILRCETYDMSLHQQVQFVHYAFDNFKLIKSSTQSTYLSIALLVPTMRAISYCLYQHQPSYLDVTFFVAGGRSQLLDTAKK